MGNQNSDKISFFIIFIVNYIFIVLSNKNFIIAKNKLTQLLTYFAVNNLTYFLTYAGEGVRGHVN